MTQTREPARPGTIDSYPVLPLRDIVVFPHMIVPLFVGREKSIRALEEVMKADTLILLATQMTAADDDGRDFRNGHARFGFAALEASRRYGQGFG